MKCRKCGAGLPAGASRKIKYCPACKVAAIQESRNKTNAKRNKTGKPKCYRVNWEAADRLIAQGISDKEIARRMGCSHETVCNRRYKLARIAKKKPTADQPLQGQYTPYNKMLANWLESCRIKYCPEKSQDDYREFLRSEDGQAFLAWLNGQQA